MPASRSPCFSELPHDLLQRVAGLLGNQERLAMLDVCSGWAAAIEAAPELWPTATLALPPTELNELEQGDRNVRAARSVMEGFAYARMCASDQDEEAAWSMMERAAMLSPRCRRVRIEGDERAKPSVAFSILSVLPASIRHLELCIPCAGPLPTALLRFRQLQQPLEGTLVADLSSATCLSSLELRIGSTRHLLALCKALPALRELSVDLYEPIEVHGLDVAELRWLPQLTLSLGIHAYYGTEAYVNYPDVEAGDHVGALPPLAGLHLTALMLIGNVFPPPDLGQLPHLRTLVLHYLDAIDWPEEKPWSAMAELACVEAIRTNLPDAALLAAAPRLAEVHAPGSPDAWRAQLAALRPDLLITPAPPA